jgi:hypothetical protein
MSGESRKVFPFKILSSVFDIPSPLFPFLFSPRYMRSQFNRGSLSSSLPPLFIVDSIIH